MPWMMFVVHFLAMLTFYIAHWQTYVTGTLKFGKLDVTEAQLTTYVIYVLTGFFGDSIWNLNVNFHFVHYLYIYIFLNSKI